MTAIGMRHVTCPQCGNPHLTPTGTRNATPTTLCTTTSTTLACNNCNRHWVITATIAALPLTHAEKKDREKGRNRSRRGFPKNTRLPQHETITIP